jgi:AcrR family transcriptional regulator
MSSPDAQSTDDPTPLHAADEEPDRELGAHAGAGLTLSSGPARPGRSRERRRSLLEAADRVVRRSGPEASMAAIAAEAGISKPVVYRHFGDKGGLYRALADRHIEDLMGRLSAALRRPADRFERTHLVVDAYLAAIEEEPQIYRFLLHRAPIEEPTLTGLVAELTRRVAEALSAGIVAELDLPETLQPTALAWAYGMVGAVQAAGDWWLQTREVPRERLVDDLCELLTRGWVDPPQR